MWRGNEPTEKNENRNDPRYSAVQSELATSMPFLLHYSAADLSYFPLSYSLIRPFAQHYYKLDTCYINNQLISVMFSLL